MVAKIVAVRCYVIDLVKGRDQFSLGIPFCIACCYSNVMAIAISISQQVRFAKRLCKNENRISLRHGRPNRPFQRSGDRDSPVHVAIAGMSGITELSPRLRSPCRWVVLARQWISVVACGWFLPADQSDRLLTAGE